MGEYWKPVNVTRKEFVHAHRVDEGLKLAEWTWPGSAVLAIVATWSPADDIRIVSDYEGDIRVTDAAKASTETVTYDSVEETDEGYKSLRSVSGPQNAETAALLVKAAAPGIPYRDWHDAWDTTEVQS
jgi:hypothetical protein